MAATSGRIRCCESCEPCASLLLLTVHALVRRDAQQSMPVVSNRVTGRAYTLSKQCCRKQHTATTPGFMHSLVARDATGEEPGSWPLPLAMYVDSLVAAGLTCITLLGRHVGNVPICSTRACLNARHHGWGTVVVGVTRGRAGAAHRCVEARVGKRVCVEGWVGVGVRQGVANCNSNSNINTCSAAQNPVSSAPSQFSGNEPAA